MNSKNGIDRSNILDKISAHNLDAQHSSIPDSLNAAINQACSALLSSQQADGHWCFELEADCTMPAEYILMMHYMDEIDTDLESKLAVYLREHQNEKGGWPLYYGGEVDLSCAVKTYFALKLAGDNAHEPHMIKAREWILQHGGAAHSNVFTRIAMALFDQVPWRAVPFIPVEIMLLPSWFPFHINKVSYWSRTVMVPLFILCTFKPKAKNPRSVSIAELFTTPPDQEQNYFPIRSKINHLFLFLDKIGRTIEPLIPKWFRRKALTKAENWIIERLNGEDGLGGIFPAIANAYQALTELGYQTDHPYRVQIRKAMRGLLVIKEKFAYCQPCFSPVWDTGLVTLTLLEEGSERSLKAIQPALSWLKEKQILSGPADWRNYRPHLAPGGWAFEYSNAHYPDLDDTAVVAWALHLAQQDSQTAIHRAAEWLAGMQSKNGGFASFDADNTHYYLNEIPFADHGALLDPPTSDVSARCATLYGYLSESSDRYKQTLDRCLAFLLQEQEADGSWYGRWGSNYIYGTWSVLTAFSATKMDPSHPAIRKAVAWLKSRQQIDGGWGESNDSYFNPQQYYQPSTSYQTAWALLGLMTVGEVNCEEVSRGISYLLRTQRQDGLWEEPWYSAPGFPKVFYLKYHGYSYYFPLWALAYYRNLQTCEPGGFLC